MTELTLTKNVSCLSEVVSIDAHDDIIIEVPVGMQAQIIDDLLDMALASSITFNIARDASLTYRFVARKAAMPSLTKILTINLIGQGACANLTCIYEGTSDQTCSISTVQRHLAPDTTSDLVIKGVLHGASVLKACNLIRIEKDAQRVRANEENTNLLLGDAARVVTFPKLEVEADDVSAAHGAAVSRINEEHLFYLASRGISECEARGMLIEAFLAS